MIRSPSLAATAVLAVALALTDTPITSAFTNQPSIQHPSARLEKSLLQVTNLPTAPGKMGVSFEDEDNHHEETLPHGVHAPIVAINSPQELVDFLQEDDRICVIKFHAAWCKSCQRFGLKFQGLANQKTDWVDSEHTVVKEGPMRFGSIEFGANTGMCRALKIKRLPTVHFYQNGEQLEGFPCGPSKFPILLDKIEHYLQPNSDSLEEILQQGDQLMNSSEVAGVLEQMIEQEANGVLDSAQTKNKSNQKGKKSWWKILP